MKKVFNQSKSILLASHVSEANGLFLRMKGLLGKKSLSEGEALWISPCTSIHTFFMQMEIDACFMDRSGCVIGLYHSMPSFRLSKIFTKACGVLELSAGTLRQSHTELGDKLVMEEA